MWLSFFHSLNSQLRKYSLIGFFLLVGLIVYFLLNRVTEDTTSKSSHRIALLLKSKNNAFYDAIVFGAREQAAKYGMDLVLHYAQNEDDWESQVNYLNDEATQFDGFIVIPNHSDKFSTVFKNLSQQQKPIVVVDTPVTNGSEYILAMISSDNIMGGRLAGLFLQQQMKKSLLSHPCVVLLSGNPHSQTHQDRNKGFFEVLNSSKSDLPIQILYGMSSFDTAKKLVEKNLQLVARCGTVFSGSDTMILGLLKAFDEASIKTPDIVIGYDSIIEAQREILHGRMSASVQQLPAEMGKVALQTLYNYFQKQPIERTILIPPRLSVRRVQLETLSQDDLQQESQQLSKVNTEN